MSRFRVDDWVGGILRSLSLVACVLVGSIAGFLVLESLPALRTLGPRLITDSQWYPAADATGGSFGLLPMIVGTLAVTAGAVLLAAPAGVASAVFCQFYAPRWVAAWYRKLIELLAGIPSVVYGFWGLVVLAPQVARLHPPGFNLLTGMLIVGLMILPTVMLVVEAALAAVPRSYIVGAAALGLGRWSIVRNIVLPEARGGIITGVVLGMARAVGETMAVVMVCGNVVRVPRGLFDPVRTLTANIALEMGYALSIHRSALFASGLLLLVMAAGMILALEWVQRQSVGQGAG